VKLFLVRLVAYALEFSPVEFHVRQNRAASQAKPGSQAAQVDFDDARFFLEAEQNQ
jgi:hypothetical protein